MSNLEDLSKLWGSVVDANEIIPNLYQGSRPPPGDILSREGFDMVVMCAKSYQPPADLFPGVEVVYAPAVDDLHQDTPKEAVQVAIEAAHKVETALDEGKKVLVTCHAGLNRSGLVSALALHFHYGWSGNDCIDQIQTNRPGSLFNPKFVGLLRNIKEK